MLWLKCLPQRVERVFNVPTNVIGWWVNGWSLRRISHVGERILRHGGRVACSYGRVADLFPFRKALMLRFARCARVAVLRRNRASCVQKADDFFDGPHMIG